MDDEISFHRLAELELNEAATYYELEKPGLGDASLQRSIAVSSLSLNTLKLGQLSLEMCVAGSFADFLMQSCWGRDTQSTQQISRDGAVGIKVNMDAPFYGVHVQIKDH